MGHVTILLDTRNGNMTKTIARWESRGGKHWVQFEEFILDNGSVYYGYTAPGAMGNLGNMRLVEAFAMVEARVLNGDFLPDAAKTPMRRTQ